MSFGNRNAFTGFTSAQLRDSSRTNLVFDFGAPTPRMEQDRNPQRSHLFTLRLWAEELSSGRVEVRCKVQHVLSGETRSFRDFVEVRAYLLDKLQQFEGEAGQGPNEWP